MDKREGSPGLFYYATILALVCLLAVHDWPARAAAAFDQPAGKPGSAADPVLSASSLRQRLDQLFDSQNQQLDEIQARLDLVSQGLQALQGKAAAPFPDLSGHWAAGAVQVLKQGGIVSGYADGNYHPDDLVTRAAMAVMLVRARNLAENPGAAVFRDVPSGYWAAGAIGAARESGYMQGYPDGTFRPQQGVSRAEAAVLLDKVLAPQGKGGAAAFSDVDSGFWAAGAITSLAAGGVFGGYPDGTFRPGRVMSRAEAAVLLAKALPSP